MKQKTIFRKQNKGAGSLAAAIRKDAVGWLLIAPALIGFIVFNWHPFVSSGILAFFNTRGFEIQDFVGFENFRNVLSDSSLAKAMINSCKYTLWSLVIGLPIPIITAILLNELVHFKGFFRFSVYFPAIIPGIVTAIMWKILLEPGSDGFLNVVLSWFNLPTCQWLQNSKLTILIITIVSTWSGFGSSTILYLADLQSVDLSLYEAAAMDGAGFFKKLRYITLPHLSSLVKVTAIMQILGVFQSFEKPLAMTGGGPNEASTTVMMLTYNYMFSEGAIDKANALSVIVCLILIAGSIVYFKATKSRD